MKFIPQCTLLACCLFLVAAFNKSLNPKSLSSGTTANPVGTTPAFLLNDAYGRLVAYDDDDGTGLSNIMSYDCYSNHASGTHVVGNNFNILWETPSTGQLVVNGLPGGLFNMGAFTSGITDNYNEVGGAQMIAFDMTSDGHADGVLAFSGCSRIPDLIPLPHGRRSLLPPGASVDMI